MNDDFERELYPSLYEPRMPDGDPESLGGLLAAVERSTLEKCAEVMGLRVELADEYGELLVDAASAMAARFDRGGKLIAFGNGGSATDADAAASDCLMPPFAGWRALPALSLAGNASTITGVANDVGYEEVFLRQIIALGEPDDIALGISTSGNSPNLAIALAESRRRGLLTIALAGYDGGALARNRNADFCFVARREFVPRIQEGHATLWHVLLELVQERLRARS